MKKSHLLFVGVSSSLAIVSMAFAPSAAKKVFSSAGYANGTWVHYAQKDATKTEKGIREYWIMCGSSAHQFTAPVGATPVDATEYDTSKFSADDDRWITPVVLDAQDVVMSAATKSLDLGEYSDMTVSSITAGAFNLGTDAANLDVSSFAADHTNDGVKEVVAYGVKNGKGYAVFTETTFVTKTISTADEWKTTLIPTTTGVVTRGYYKVTSDLTLTYTPGWFSGWDKSPFSGTLDGGYHKVTLAPGQYGQFYALQNAAVKNMTLHNSGWERTKLNSHLLANKSIESKFENLTFDVPSVKSNATDSFSPVANYGYLFGNGGVQKNSFKNCSWDFDNYDLPSLLSHATNNTATNTFENSTLRCKSLSELYYTNKGETIVSADGLAIELTDAELVSMDRAEIDLSASSYSVTLPVQYTGLEVLDITVNAGDGKHSLGNDLSNLQIPQAVKNATQSHGNTSLIVKYQLDSTKVKYLEVPVTFVTKCIASSADLLALTHTSGQTTYGYYKLTANIDISKSGWSEFTGNPADTFSGTLDGNGLTITSKARTYGMFGTLANATIKNLTVLDAWSYGGCTQNSTLLSRDMTNSTIENCTFKVTAVSTNTVDTTINTSLALSAQSYGLVNSRICQNNTFKDCTFDAGSAAVQTLVGTHSSCVDITFVNSTFTCGTYYCLYQSSYKKLVTTTSAGLTITGTCVYTPAE